MIYVTSCDRDLSRFAMLLEKLVRQVCLIGAKTSFSLWAEDFDE
jgi:hypothetical protein